MACPNCGRNWSDYDVLCLDCRRDSEALIDYDWNEDTDMITCHACGQTEWFADKDPVGFVQMVDASKALNAMIPEDVQARWAELKSRGKTGVS